MKFHKIYKKNEIPLFRSKNGLFAFQAVPQNPKIFYGILPVESAF
jgi:hypothetical protein